MILGLGSDLVDIRRIEKSIERFGDRFLDRLFTDEERATADSRKQRASAYAKRFAAKEACSKALGCGLANGVFWRDMGVVNMPGGRPALVLTDGADRRLNDMIPAGMRAAVHLTMTDEYPYAQAFVIIEALPNIAGQH